MHQRIATVLALAALGLAGCGAAEATKKNQVTATSAASDSQLDKIKEALAKVGIKNPPAAVFDQDDKTWNVVITPDGVGPNGEPPPGRPIPQRVLVAKTDFKVTKMADPNQRPQGKGRETSE